MANALVAGAVAGAAGTLALEVVSWGDVLVRARATSSMPAKAAQGLAAKVGVDLGPPDDERTQNRAGALGALLGYATGVGVGVAYAVVRRGRPSPSPLRSALLVGGAAMAIADSGLVAQGLTDPRTWGLAGWLSDAVPHVAYGAAAVGVHRLLVSPGRAAG